MNSLIITIPGASIEELTRAEDMALAFLAARGTKPFDAALANFHRDAFFEFGIEITYDDDAAQAWEEVTSFVKQELGLASCMIELNRAAFASNQSQPQRQLS